MGIDDVVVCTMKSPIQQIKDSTDVFYPDILCIISGLLFHEANIELDVKVEEETVWHRTVQVLIGSALHSFEKVLWGMVFRPGGLGESIRFVGALTLCPGWLEDDPGTAGGLVYARGLCVVSGSRGACMYLTPRGLV